MNDQEFNDVTKPKHYSSHDSGVECKEVSLYLPATLSTAFKYIWRYEDKENPLQDLQKCIWYIEESLEINKSFMILSIKLSKKMFEKDKSLVRKLETIIEVEQNKHRKNFFNCISAMMNPKFDEKSAYDAIVHLKTTVQMLENDLIHNFEKD